MTTFADQLFQLGGMPVGGVLRPGKQVFVNPYFGNDGNSGADFNHPMKTLRNALANRTNATSTFKAGNVIYLISSSNTATYTTDYLETKLSWNVDNTDLIGINAGSRVSQRSRISTASTAVGTAVAPLVEVSASNCRWENIAVFAGVPASAPTSALGCVLVSGQRNFFRNCHFAGTGDATMNAATQFSLKVTGSENHFEDCTIGLDTIARTTASGYEMYFSGGATRNSFRRCRIVTYAGINSHTFITVPVNGIDRWNLFEDCIFINMPTGIASGTTMTNGFSITGGGSPDGCILLKDCKFVGITNSEASTGSGRLLYYANGTGKFVATTF